ncbi:MAG: hypothetical protein IT350_17315 [Deltaproteobacteria bacterium]|nr:hypothetical protein [Deltaproteobacteria bacterium]
MTAFRFAIVALLVSVLFTGGCDEGDSASSDRSGGGDDDVVASDDDAQSDAPTDDDDAGGSTITSSGSLLERFLPVIVQQLPPDDFELPYPPEYDLMGEVHLGPGDEEFLHIVSVDTNAPTVYATVRHTQIGEHVFSQLIYATFYPARAPHVTFAQNPIKYIPEYLDSGAIDGKVIRITLDATEQVPLFIEVARTCGCDWKLFVNRAVDDAARAEAEAADLAYTGLIDPKAPHDVPYVWIMPADFMVPDARPVVVADWGWDDYPHQVQGSFTSVEQWIGSDLDVESGVVYAPEGAAIGDEAALPVETYAAMDYDTLYTMPSGDEPGIGIFDGRGYIWNSYARWACWECWGPNALFAGTPRDLAELEVVHETLHYWDAETLIGRFITLPASIF